MIGVFGLLSLLLIGFALDPFSGSDDEGDEADPTPGPDGNDTLNGTEGDDTLNGTPGDDLLNGFGGDDFLQGFTGDDILLGGNGDLLNGGAGGDEFHSGTWVDPATPTEIEDYNPAEDQLVLYYDPTSAVSADVTVTEDDTDALVSFNGQLVMRVLGQAGSLTPADIALFETTLF